MGAYQPTAYDIAWTKRLWGRLKVGGLWSYKDKPIAMRKDSDKAATLFVFRPDFTEVERLTAVMRACDIVTTESDTPPVYEGYSGLWS